MVLIEDLHLLWVVDVGDYHVASSAINNAVAVGWAHSGGM